MSEDTIGSAGTRQEAPELARRRFLTTIGAVATVCLSGYGLNAVVDSFPISAGELDLDLAAKTYGSDIVLGSRAAAVTVVEYASLTCVHCARFHTQSLPAFVDRWVAPGKVRLVFRHFPLDSTALSVASMVSCLPEGDRADAVARLMAAQSSWMAVGDPGEAAAGLLSVSGQAASRCLSDLDKQRSVLVPVSEARRAGIASTPTFVIGRRPYVGFMSSDALGAIVERELAARELA
ncbi:MAG: hypothetical protein EOR63_32460 [Mesorhizobium sp.]|nr:MAG: hypothetical protein EOR63_32460 [Mesorhizobium sp.]